MAHHPDSSPAASTRTRTPTGPPTRTPARTPARTPTPTARRPRRLRDVLVGWLLVPTLLLGILSFWYGQDRHLQLANEAYDRTLLGSALVIAESLRVTEDLVVADFHPAALEMLRTAAQNRVYYRVADADDGRVVTGYEDLPGPPEPFAAATMFYDATYKGEAVRIAAVRRPLLVGEGQRQLVVQVAETLAARRALMRQIVIDAALVQLLLIAASVAAVVFAVHRGLAPLLELGHDLRRRAASDTTPIPGERVVPEVAPLIEAINAHSQRQRELGEALARFVANASHQLKTPLTGLQALVDLALQQPNPSRTDDVLHKIRASGRWMQRMIGQLLVLARSEPGQALVVEALDLVTIAREVTFEALGAARVKRIDLGFQGEPTAAARVRGDATLVRELIANLVHNAITHTPAGGHVTVLVHVGGGTPMLEVVDDGPGIAPADRRRVFQRFLRLAGSAAGAGVDGDGAVGAGAIGAGGGAGDSATAGSGLGLAIVKEICDRHGVAIDLGDGPAGQGLRVVLAWPTDRA